MTETEQQTGLLHKLVNRGRRHADQEREMVLFRTFPDSEHGCYITRSNAERYATLEELVTMGKIIKTRRNASMQYYKISPSYVNQID